MTCSLVTTSLLLQLVFAGVALLTRSSSINRGRASSAGKCPDADKAKLAYQVSGDCFVSHHAGSARCYSIRAPAQACAAHC
jgi:hypothetical protein